MSRACTNSDGDDSVSVTSRCSETDQVTLQQNVNIDKKGSGDSIKDVGSSAEQNGEGVTEKPKVRVRRTGGHRAGFDSFMTGYAFACAFSQFGCVATDNDSVKLNDVSALDDVRNKVTLSGKDIPLLIKKGNFAKTSLLHNEKIVKLKAVI